MLTICDQSSQEMFLTLVMLTVHTAFFKNTHPHPHLHNHSACTYVYKHRRPRGWPSERLRPLLRTSGCDNYLDPIAMAVDIII